MKYPDNILSTLNSLKGSGSFWSSGVQDFVLPGLNLNKFGELAFPINPTQLETLIGHAKKAPFGKGEATVLDNTVRSTWEIDASQISFKNPRWEKLISKIVKQIKPTLGIEGYTISANLYKMLIYGPGDFFLMHRDSEKEAGMFGTLIIGLPSPHTGGEFVVGFDGKEQQLSFASAVDDYKIPYIAFYADCEHEVKPVLSGYRVCLTYNLIQNATALRPKAYALQSKVDELAALFQEAEEEFSTPKAILLGHQYTPANFGFESLKLNDRPKTEVLLKAAEKLGFYAKLGLVTSFQSGELLTDEDYFNYKSRWDGNSDDSSGDNDTMGEIFDEYIQVEHWATDDLPALDDLQLEQKDIVADFALNEGEPTEKESEGYTGNAGMEMSYWYHYGAVFVWSKKTHAQILNQLSLKANLKWLNYYTSNWETISIQEKQLAGLIFDSSQSFEQYFVRADVNFNALAEYLHLQPPTKIFTATAKDILLKYFDRISIENWVAIVQSTGINNLEPFFEQLAAEENPLKTAQLLHVFEALSAHNEKDFQPLLKKQLSYLPGYLEGVNFANNKEKNASLTIIKLSVNLSQFMPTDKIWLQQMCNSLTANPNRKLVNELIAAQLLQPEFANFPLTKPLLEFCKHYLQQKVDNKPPPPTNWIRTIPSGSRNSIFWSLLGDFMQSPTEQVFLYKKLQADRKNMENFIRRSEADLSMETIRKGSPHTLKISKTQASYERRYKHWQQDEKLLNEIKTRLR
ncbi:MAG: 2OG-Fe(II) oxygenase [Bacteroidales bacterium]|nr:2OG-Fe(II) oxygenase [Bacteroidales bacterium]